MKHRLAVSILIVIAVMAAPLAAHAQPATKVPRVGYLGAEDSSSLFFEAFRAGLRRLGYVEGKNIMIESRHAEGRADRLPALASELVGLKVDVLVAVSGPAAQTARRAAGTIPLVIGVSGDPVVGGFVTSLARPGGNVTGMSYLQPELAGKRLQLLREIAPKVTRVAVLVNPNHAGENQEWQEMDAAAKTMGMTLVHHVMPVNSDLTEVFAAITTDRTEAIVMVPGPLTNANRKPIADFGLRARLPVIAAWSEHVEAGGLLSYGPSRRDTSRRLAAYVDRIIKGEKPADLPVERAVRSRRQPQDRELLGITIPPSLLLQADEVIV